MPRLYPPTEAPDRCENCGGELDMFSYQGAKLGCPNCIPDGIVEKYGL